jgi:hypothetical protein
MIRRLVFLLLMSAALGLSGSACSESTPTGPSTPSLSLAGAWTGTWTFVSAGATVTDTVAMTLSQTGASVNGQWSSSGGASGTIGFSAAATISGSAAISQTLLTGATCTASTTLTGTATTTAIQFSLGSLSGTGLCQWATGHQFSFSK